MTTGDMDRPSEGDRPGAVDDAIWTELVASFHASTTDKPGLWPEAENLPGDPDGPDPSGAAGTATAAGSGAGIGPQAPGQDVTRPAEPTPGVHPAAGGGIDGAVPPSASPATPSRVVRPAARHGRELPPAAPPAVTWTGGPRDYAPAEPVDEDGYVPPPPPPLPELGMATKAAWLAGLGGPGYLALATILHWDTPQWASLLCVLAGVIGFGYLVSKLKDRPEDGDDDPDDPTYGAVL
jgi:hypothetical protein